MGLFDKLKQGLQKTRNAISEQVNQVFKVFVKVDEELFEELEEALIMADIGVETSTYIIDTLRDRVKTKHITDGNEVKEELQAVISEILTEQDASMHIASTPAVILVIGVNGVGKTTSIGKLASHYKEQGKKVLLAAADTFRAAAIDQLAIWAERSGCDIIKQEENSDPAAVVFDACRAAKARNMDILICDTAGRLHNKKNLMAELEKISRVISRELPEAEKEILLVLDATTGQNAVSQAKLFSEAADITGIVLTKLDGTAKGGIVISIAKEQHIPVKFVGVGEGVDDLQEFYPAEFASALFEE
jgi:fused signal recognition particle receptor